MIDGKAVAAGIRQERQARVRSLIERHRIFPGLAVILAGYDPASSSYGAASDQESCFEWVFATATGTAANSLSLAAICPPFGGVLCHRLAHINTDECGAPEFFTAGAKLLPCDGEHAKLTAESAATVLATFRGDIHQSPPRALSISQAKN